MSKSPWPNEELKVAHISAWIGEARGFFTSGYSDDLHKEEVEKLPEREDSVKNALQKCLTSRDRLRWRQKNSKGTKLNFAPEAHALGKFGEMFMENHKSPALENSGPAEVDEASSKSLLGDETVPLEDATSPGGSVKLADADSILTKGRRKGDSR